MDSVEPPGLKITTYLLETESYKHCLNLLTDYDEREPESLHVPPMFDCN